MYPGARQGRQGRIVQEDHPLPSPPREADCISDIKVVLLNDYCGPEVGFAPKRNLAVSTGTGDASVPAPARTRRGENVQVSSVCSLPAGQASTASASPFQVLTLDDSPLPYPAPLPTCPH